MKLIQIEGPDCSFKDTVIKELYLHLLIDYLLVDGDWEGISCINSIDYDSQSSYYIKKYLEEGYGPISKVSGFPIACMYAMQRYDIVNSEPFNKLMLNEKAVVLVNRWTSSNIVYQSNDSYEIAKKISNLEHKELHIPIPDLSITLYQDFNLAQSIMSEREGNDKLETNIPILKQMYNRYYSDSSAYAKYLSDNNITSYTVPVCMHDPVSDKMVPKDTKTIVLNIMDLISRYVHKKD